MKLINLFHCTAATADTCGFITDSLIEKSTVVSYIFEDLFPLSFPVGKLLAFFIKHFRSIAYLEKRLIFIPLLPEF